MDRERNKRLFKELGKQKVDAAVEIAGNDRIRFTALQHTGSHLETEEAPFKSKQLYLLLGKELIDAAVEIAVNERIRFTAIQHAGRLIEMEEELAKNRHPGRIAKQVGMTERTVRRHRDD